jgi:hypothetical protein
VTKACVDLREMLVAFERASEFGFGYCSLLRLSAYRAAIPIGQDLLQAMEDCILTHME